MLGVLYCTPFDTAAKVYRCIVLYLHICNTATKRYDTCLYDKTLTHPDFYLFLSHPVFVSLFALLENK